MCVETVLNIATVSPTDSAVHPRETQSDEAQDVESTPMSPVAPRAREEPRSEGYDGAPQYPLRSLGMFLLLWAIVLVSIFLRGGKGMQGAVEQCSASYWTITVFTGIYLVCIGTFATWNAIARQPLGPPVDGDIYWNQKSGLKVVVWSFVAGVLAALCGIGGGMVMGPRLLELGVLPQVQSSTTATTLFVLSTSTAILFMVSGSTSLDYALFLATMTACGAIFGKALVNWIVKKTQRPSFLIFILGFIISSSVVVMMATGILDVVRKVDEDQHMGFLNPCSGEPL